MGSRGLTSGERDILFSMYGNSINLNSIRIYDERWSGGWPGSIIAPNGNVYFAPSFLGERNSRYRDDYSAEGPSLLRVFVHEMHHVWEAQHNINVRDEGINLGPLYLFGKPYNISDVQQGALIHEKNANGEFVLNLEQRATIAEQYYMARIGQPTDRPLEFYSQIFLSSPLLPQGPATPTIGPFPPTCFAEGTPILMADGTEKVIEDIRIGDEVLAFDPSQQAGRGIGIPCKVTRLFTGFTTEWLVLRKDGAQESHTSELAVTPGHLFLTTDGKFRRVDQIVADDNQVILADGSAATIASRRIRYTNETASLFAEEQFVSNAVEGAIALAPQVSAGWKTFNFEVEGLHTYIAGGLRVHNRCDATFVISEAEASNLLGHSFTNTPQDINQLMEAILSGQLAAEGHFFGSTDSDRFTAPLSSGEGDRIVIVGGENSWAASVVRGGQLEQTLQVKFNGERVETTYDLTDTQPWQQQTTKYGENGGAATFSVTVDDVNAVITEVNGSIVTNIGATFGSQLGNILAKEAGDNPFASVAIGTLAGAVGAHLGKLIKFDNMFANATDYNMAALDAAYHQVNTGFSGSLIGVGITQISSLLVAELVDELGIDGFEGAVFQTIGTSITAKLVSNIYNVAVLGANPTALFAGFDGAFATGVFDAVGNILGGTLAAEVVYPSTQAESIGASIGSSIGGLIGTFLIPIPGLGSAIGSFLGSIAGNYLGGLFGSTPHATGAVYYETGQFVGGGSGTHGGDPTAFIDIAREQAKVVNALVALTGGRADPTSGATIRYEQGGDDFEVWVNDQIVFGTTSLTNSLLASQLDPALLGLLHHIDINGGDIILRRAWENSQAGNVTAFASDLQIAQDYRLYLENAPLINAIMASAPDSAFTTGWALTLLKAEELGLNKASVTDFQDGIVAHIGNQIGDYLDWRPSVDPLEPDTLILTSADGLTVKTFDNVFGPEAIHRVASGDDADTINLAALPVEKLVYVTAGGGSDTVTGSAGTDILDGGAGNDVINGGGGHDWVYGGDGNDTLAGGDGNDLVAGGAGDDTLINDDGIDTLVGGAGNDVFVFNTFDPGDTVVAATSDAGAQTDVIRLGDDADSEMSSFSIDGADLKITWRKGTWTTEQVVEDGIPFPVRTFHEESFGDIVVKDFYLTKSGIDSVEFVRNGSVVWSWDNTQLWSSPVAGAPYLHSAAMDGGGTREVRLDGLSNQLWVSKDTRFDASGHLTREVTYWDNGTSTEIVGAVVTINGTSGNDSIDGGNLAETILGYGGADTLKGQDGDDVIFGGDGNDTLEGGAGNDTLDGGAGADTLKGGTGNDTYVVDNTGDSVTEQANEGTDLVRAALASYTLGANVENLTFTDDATHTGTGNTFDNAITGAAGNDTLTGLAGNDTLDGGAGADSLTGGAGNDIYVVDNSSDAVNENPGEGTDTVRTALASHTLSANVENLTFTDNASHTATGNSLANVMTGGAGDDTFWGGDGNDTLTGGAGSDILIGGAGADTMDGGAGDDFYDVDNTADVVSEASGGGDDTVQTTLASYTLGANIEGLNGYSPTAQTLTGNELANNIDGSVGNDSLFGGAGDDTLNGGGGADSLAGGTGNDTYVVDNSSDTVNENANEGIDTVQVLTALTSFTLSANVENLTFTDDEFNTAHTGTGNALANVMTGAAGNDTFFAGDGSDTLSGGAGNDVLVAHSDQFLQQADFLFGGSGDDTLYGDAFDTLSGFTGFDRLYVINSYDMNLNLATAGIEWVQSGWGNDTFNASTATTAIEVYASGGNDSVTGGSGHDIMWGSVGNDTLTGNGGNDVLVGEDGADSLSGGDGNDTLYVDSTDTTFDGGAGTDTLFWTSNGVAANIDLSARGVEWVQTLSGNDALNGSAATAALTVYAGAGADTVTGGSGADFLWGDLGDDTIWGRGGNDTLSGNDGNDLLVGELGADSLFGGDGNDTLYVDSTDVAFDGGAGTDTLFWTSDGVAANIDLSARGLETVQTLSGNDTLNGSAATAALTAYTGAGADTVTGGSGADTLWGELGNDTLTGNGGNDTLVGGAGQDTLSGGSGNDSLYGNVGSGGDGVLDSFVFNSGWGVDTVYDFDNGTDKFDMRSLGTNFAALTVTSFSGHALVSFGGNSITVVNAAGQIDQSDFLFV